MIPLLYALITAAATLIGGAAPMYTGLRRVEQRYLVAFAGGAMVAIALFDLIPTLASPNAVSLFVGFFSIYLLEKLVMIHTCGEIECETHSMGWPAIIGIAGESLVDGLAIAVGYQVAPALGLLIALAVFVHEVPRGLATTVIMQDAGYGRAQTWFALLVDAGFAPLGVLLAAWVPVWAFEELVGFTAGVFLYVGASDLLPEAHRRFNLRVVMATMAGAVLIPALSLLLG